MIKSSRLFLLFVLISMLSSIQAYAQVLTKNNFTPIESRGEVPLDFRISVQATKEEYKENTTGGVSTKPMSKEERIEQEFAISQQYHINQMLHSGKIFFGDSVTEYLNDVAEKLLENTFPELIDELRIYASFSPAVNAYSTDAGVIIVNVGLIAQLTNEAQLAFYIAHEIAHYVKKHSITSFKEEKNETSGYGFVRNDDYLLRKNSRSRQIEREADKYAFEEIFLPAGYCPKTLNIAFDILKYSYLPLDEISFPLDFFDSEYFKANQECFLEEKDINPIAVNEDYDEEKSTHPACEERKTKLLSFVNEEEINKGDKFKLSEERFKRIRDIARFEMIHSQLLACDYVNVIYNCFIMRRDYPENLFIEKAIVYSEYAIAKYKSDNDVSDVLPYYKRIEGASGQVSYFFKKIDEVEMNIIALRSAYDLHQQYPEDEFIDNIYDDLVRELIYEHSVVYSSFDSEIYVQTEEADTVKEVDEEESKYSRISSKQEQEEGSNYSYAFLDAVKDKDFMERFEYWEERNLKEKEEEDEETSEETDKEEEEEEMPDDINKIIVFDPLFISIDLRNNKKSLIEYEKTELKRKAFSDDIIEIANMLGIETELISADAINEDDAEMYNVHRNINSWIYEVSSHEIDDDDYIIFFESQYLNNVIDYSDAKYLLWPISFDVKEQDEMEIYTNCCYAAVLFPLAPYFLYKAFAPQRTSQVTLILLDIESGYAVDYEEHYMKSKFSKDKVKSVLYSTMFKYKK